MTREQEEEFFNNMELGPAISYAAHKAHEPPRVRSDEWLGECEGTANKTNEMHTINCEYCGDTKWVGRMRVDNCPLCAGVSNRDGSQSTAPVEITCSEWVAGVGVIGWKRVMSRELFETQDAAMQWAQANGLKEVEYIPACEPKTPATDKLTD